MLDVSFSELVVCLLVALVVLGPEKLPGAARAVGRWTGKARAYMRTFTAELEREAQLSEIRKQLEETQRILREQSTAIERSAQGLAEQARALPQTLESSAAPAATPESAAPVNAPAAHAEPATSHAPAHDEPPAPKP